MLRTAESRSTWRQKVRSLVNSRREDDRRIEQPLVMSIVLSMSIGKTNSVIVYCCVTILGGAWRRVSRCSGAEGPMSPTDRTVRTFRSNHPWTGVPRQQQSIRDISLLLLPMKNSVIITHYRLLECTIILFKNSWTPYHINHQNVQVFTRIVFLHMTVSAMFMSDISCVV